MEKRIVLKDFSVIRGRISFVLTNKAFETLYNIYSANYRNFLAEFSAEKNFLIEKKLWSDGSCSYIIHYKGFYINCSENHDKNTNAVLGLLITSIKQEDFNSKISAMTNGQNICFSEGSCITIRVKSQNLYEEYVNGTHYNDTNNSRLDYSGTFRKLAGHFDSLNIQTDIEDTQAEEFEISDEFDAMLELAENYSNLESMLEENRVRADGGLSYTKIQALEYERTDRMAYRFLVTAFKKDTYAKGTQIEFEDVLGNTINAEVLEHGKDENNQAFLDALFKGQINIKSFAAVGTIRLSFSPIIKSVQQNAIDRLRNNEAPAKYMDNVLGLNQPQGFNNLNLSKLETFYADKDKKNYDYKDTFPPNPSQVEAITNGIKSKDVFLVMGPPGTGKTTVILEWIKYFVLEKQMRVLVSSQNNKAVDNVIERIIEEEGIDVLRIGSEAKLQENVKECMYENKIAALRNNIATATNNNISALNALINLWNAYLTKFPSLYDALGLVDSTKGTLEKVIKSKLFPTYKSINSTYSHITSTQTSIRFYQCKMQSKLEYEKKRDMATNTIVRLWFSLLFFVFKPFIRRYATNIHALKASETTAISNYKKLLEKYKKQYSDVANGEFAAFLNAQERYSELAENVFADKLDSVAGIFDFSENPIEFTASAALKGFEKKVELEIKRAKSTTEVLAEWSQDIAGEQTYALEKIVLENVNLVGATCIGISSQKRFSDLNFDVTIIDEAGQIQIHNALVPMSLSNKLIMLGDHKQIPPSADEEILQACKDHGVDATLLKKSLFENMYNLLPNSNKRMLDTQFRMPAEIADIISEWFYSGEYKSPDFKRNLVSEMPEISEKPFIIIDTSDSKKRFETAVTIGEQTVRYNDLECELIVDIIKHLNENNYKFSEIGIIAGLKAQVNRIKESLVKTGFDRTTVNEMVATLDSFQGQERKIILYSFTRSSKKPPEVNRIGFLTELRRINVAMSRCKKTMVMIGDMPFLANCQSTVDFHGDETEKDQTEKNFSEFISKMLTDVQQNGRGELLTSAELKLRLYNKGKE